MRIFTTTLIVASLGWSGGGYAADIKASKYTAPEPVYVPVESWTGFYIGGNIGGLFSTGDDNFSVWKKARSCDCEGSKPDAKYIASKSYKVRSDNNDDQFIGGVHLGYNWQSGSVVSGLEGDVDFGDNIDYLASIRGRLGVTSGATLFYATGGVAFIGYSDDLTLEKTAGYNKGVKATFGRDSDDVGFVVGGGIEHKFSRNWSIGVEALYYNFDTDNMNKYAVKYMDNERGHKRYIDGSFNEEFVAVRGRLTYHVTEDYVPLK